MARVKNDNKKFQETGRDYSRFAKVDGRHPLQKRSPDSVVTYKARTRHGGKVAIFNYHLAKEVGLIPEDHPHKMDKELERAVLDAFAIMIINEYDEMNNIQFPSKDIKRHEYMATRYLQLQHPDKRGLGSGDGRSVWNGQLKHKGKTYDISSCGTGATRLSPACVINKKFYQSGDPSISYGCGYSEIDEGFSSIFFSEVLGLNGIKTERVLAVLQFEKDYSITVRVHENLIRPSHLFRPLKQGNLEELKNITDYYIDKQIKNGKWSDFSGKESEKYDYLLDEFTNSMANMAAKFEDEYIFCWLDWDGDNILMDGSIIDYGSVRQFGLFHHEYRFDDVERFSTTILEQKNKARDMVQVFSQLVDFIKTGKKKPIEKFKSHKSLKNFDKIFEDCKNENILYRIGFRPEAREVLLKKELKLIKEFRKHFTYFERSKSVEGVTKVVDGINWNAIFCMRDILRELPQLLLMRSHDRIADEEFMEIIKSNYAVKKDLEMSEYRHTKIRDYQKTYMQLIEKVAKYQERSVEQVMLEISMRSSVINKFDRVTGDSITNIVHEVLAQKPRLSADNAYELLEEFMDYQNLDPQTKRDAPPKRNVKNPLMKGVLKIVREFREGL